MQDIRAWQHDHRFGTEATASGERRTRWMVGLPLAMMAGVIAAGVVLIPHANTASVLLDGEVSEERRLASVRTVELSQQARVADLHVWRVVPRHLAAIATVFSASPRGPDHCRARLGGCPDLAHVTVEVHSGGLESVEFHVDKQVR